MAGIPVRAHWSALAITAVIVGLLGTTVLPRAVPGSGQPEYWLVAVVTGVLFIASLLAHELAHALVARRCALDVGSVTLWVLGGYTEVEAGAKSPRVELATAAAGPLVSLGVAVLSLLAYLFLPRPALPASGAAWLGTMNLLLGLFNLLPGAPLDGGRVLHALVWWRSGDASRADRAAARAGHVLGTTLLSTGVVIMLLWNWLNGLWLAVLGWYIATSARQELTLKLARAGLGGLTVRDVMTPMPDLAPAWMNVEGLIQKVVLNSRQTIFPVVTFTGTPVGSVSLDTLAAVPAERRSSTRVETLTTAQRPVRTLAPGDGAVLLLDQSPQSRLVAAVVEDGRLVGMVTGADLGRALGQALLRTGADAHTSG
ncbi:site-2 protease family protein [Nonomuraea rhodomycinica]|uniref:Zinc metalloprotease n=1 Tax=Nonomuraea rhodomycinica TaxID=1712872 RepID=A0A7Y6MAH0_9ACTN|nr:site-2 protease family protein [Nonomuraea rhodomycinica]NUW39469.1 site-2 protease family protein [Nonomuraea rhodomycinica]